MDDAPRVPAARRSRPSRLSKRKQQSRRMAARRRASPANTADGIGAAYRCKVARLLQAGRHDPHGGTYEGSSSHCDDHGGTSTHRRGHADAFEPRGRRCRRQVSDPLQGTAPVQTLSRANQIVVSPGQKGATYYWLESQTKKLTTRFPGVTATAERDAYGTLSTTLTDPAGNELGRFQMKRPDGIHDVLTLRPSVRRRAEGRRRSGRRDRPSIGRTSRFIISGKTKWTPSHDARMAKRHDAAERRRPRNAERRHHRARNRVDRRPYGENCPETRHASRSSQRSIRRRRSARHAPGRQRRQRDWRQLLVLAPQLYVWSIPALPNRRVHRPRASPCRLRRMAVHPGHGMDEPAGAGVPSLQRR